MRSRYPAADGTSTTELQLVRFGENVEIGFIQDLLPSLVVYVGDELGVELVSWNASDSRRPELSGRGGRSTRKNSGGGGGIAGAFGSSSSLEEGGCGAGALLSAEGSSLLPNLEIPQLPEPAQSPLSPKSEFTVEDLFLSGQQLEGCPLNVNSRAEPEHYYREALLRTNNKDARSNVALGLVFFRRGLFEKAETRFRVAISTLTRFNPNPKDGEAFFYLGVCLRACLVYNRISRFAGVGCQQEDPPLGSRGGLDSTTSPRPHPRGASPTPISSLSSATALHRPHFPPTPPHLLPTTNIPQQTHPC